MREELVERLIAQRAGAGSSTLRDGEAGNRTADHVVSEGDGLGHGPERNRAIEPQKVKAFAIRPDGASEMGSSGSQGSSTSVPTRLATQSAHVTRAPTGASTHTASISTPGAATASAPRASGDYMVQLVSNKSEAETQSSFKVLQFKYPTVLGTRAALIRRVELGDRGTYYRAHVGPFANADQANVLCDRLKSAGGQCLVHKN